MIGEGLFDYIYLKGELTMSLKEKLAKKILETKLNKATKHAKSYIQQLQQQFDNIVEDIKDKSQ